MTGNHSPTTLQTPPRLGRASATELWLYRLFIACLYGGGALVLWGLVSAVVQYFGLGDTPVHPPSSMGLPH